MSRVDGHDGGDKERKLLEEKRGRRTSKMVGKREVRGKAMGAREGTERIVVDAGKFGRRLAGDEKWRTDGHVRGRTRDGRKEDDRKWDVRKEGGRRGDVREKNGRRGDVREENGRKGDDHKWEGRKEGGRKWDVRAENGRRGDDRKWAGRKEYGQKEDGRKDYDRKEDGRKVNGRTKDGQKWDGGKEGRRSQGRFGPQKPGKPWSKSDGPCPVMRQCGGCQLLNLDYKEQLKRKQRQVEELFKDICPVKPMIGMENPFHYRNKVHAVFDRDKRGNIISGIYQENSHIVVPVDKCLIEDEKADEIIGSIRGMLKSFKIRTYDEDTEFGLLRHVLIRRAFATNEIMVVLVTASPILPSKNNFVKALREKHPEITTIVQNVNGRGTSMVLGKKENVLYGKGFIVDELCGCRFRISAQSFYQINPVQTEVLYAKAMELAGFTGKEVVVDAYCGIGTIGIVASKLAGQVIGVELNQDAVRDAVSNAKLNGRGNIRFYCNDAGRFLVNMAERGEKADVVIMDPPRSGSSQEFMDSVGKMGVEKVVYVSCNPETLARDVRYMMKMGYRGVGAWGVDMFPWASHVETVCLLSNRKSKPDSHVDLSLDMEDYYRIKDQEK